jgi:hypothetical protein
VITHFQAGYHRLLKSFSAGSAEKQVLRYTGKQVDRQQVSIRLPRTATVVSGSIRINESLHPGRPSVGDDLLGNAPIAEDLGLRINATAAPSAGQRLNPANAVSVQGIALGMMALTPDTQISLEVQADWQSKPSGKKIASGSATLKEAGRLQWVIVSFKETLAIPSQPHWILVGAAKGDAVWLVEPGSDSAGLLEFQAGSWNELARLQGYKTLHRLLPPAPAGEDAAPAGAHLSIAALDVQSVTLKDSNQKDIGRLFDVASAINGFLAAVRAGTNVAEKIDIPLVFTSGSSGLITVYPPELNFETV